MNRYILSVIIISVLIIPVPFASAATGYIKFIHNGEDESSPSIYAFVQITHRNSNGDLLALIQSDKMTHLDTDGINHFIDRENSKENRNPHIFKSGENYLGLFSEIFVNKINRVDLTASTLLTVSLPSKEHPGQYEQVMVARFAHDGLLLNPGDVVTSSWYFIQLL